jgi:hypothetical protein
LLLSSLLSFISASMIHKTLFVSTQTFCMISFFSVSDLVLIYQGFLFLSITCPTC